MILIRRASNSEKGTKRQSKTYVKLTWEFVSLVRDKQYFMFMNFRRKDACSSSVVEMPAWISQAPSLIPAVE